MVRSKGPLENGPSENGLVENGPFDNNPVGFLFETGVCRTVNINNLKFVFCDNLYGRSQPKYVAPDILMKFPPLGKTYH